MQVWRSRPSLVKLNCKSKILPGGRLAQVLVPQFIVKEINRLLKAMGLSKVSSADLNNCSISLFYCKSPYIVNIQVIYMAITLYINAWFKKYIFLWNRCDIQYSTILSHLKQLCFQCKFPNNLGSFSMEFSRLLCHFISKYFHTKCTYMSTQWSTRLDYHWYNILSHGYFVSKVGIFTDKNMLFHTFLLWSCLPSCHDWWSILLGS